MNPYAFCENSKRKPFCQKLRASRTVLFALLCGVAFAFAALQYNDKMIVAAPQLNDWGKTSAEQTIALTEYLLAHYNIDPDRVYANGYSGGGETMSRVLGMRPDLFTAYLHCSSQWDGAYEPVVKARIPVYLVVGEGDEY